MLERFPFWDRAALLAGLMIMGAALDRWRNGPAATRTKEYGFIWLTGAIGAVVGGVNDLITSSISPDYFILGKGLPAGEGLQMRAVLFGVKEGLSAGVIAGAICVYVARVKSRRPPLEFGSVLRLLWIPTGCALIGALVVPLTAGHSDPAGLALKLADTSQAAVFVPPFLLVWWIHTGLYAGLAGGVLWMLAKIWVLRGGQYKAGPTGEN